jgi:hypothetical protein
MEQISENWRAKDGWQEYIERKAIMGRVEI